jgi:putative membrane protein
MDNLMPNELLASLNGFFLHFLAAVVLVMLFALIYIRITPYAEFRLIREGKIAPAISFGGALLGFVMALAGAITNSVSFPDMLIWSSVALLVQVSVFVSLRRGFPELCLSIAEDQLAPAILLGVLSLAAGILNAACMSY